MKTSLLIILFAGVISIASSQTVTVPRKDFDLLAAPATIRVVRGDSTAVDIFILRSKETRKAKVKMGMSSGAPKGVVIRFEPGNGNIDQSKTIVSVDDSTPPGTYNLILSATMRNKTKGIIVSLLVL
jgi:hypothetical protein